MSQNSKKKSLIVLGTIAAYCFIGIEIIIMISPFALYFYSVYAPILEFFAATPYLSWTTEFFLPHMVFIDDPLVMGISYLQILMVVGLLLFFSAAVPLYYGRFTNKGVVQMSFYSRIRHPQYLFLAISGFGLLLYWPRFIILILYVTMLFGYYFLAKNEEWRMQQEAPGHYDNYMKNTPMFFPGEPGDKIFNVLFSWIKPKALGMLSAYGVALLMAVALAAGIREYTIKQIPTVSAGSYSMISVFPRHQQEVLDLYTVVKNSDEVQSHLQEGLQPNLIYLFPGDFFLTAIVTDQDRRWFADDDISKRIPEIFEWHQHKFRGGIGDFFKIFYNFFSTLSDTETDFYVDRLVFVEVQDKQGVPVERKDLFKIGVKRAPVLIVDIDHETKKVVSVMRTSGAHKWGYMPMPSF